MKPERIKEMLKGTIYEGAGWDEDGFLHLPNEKLIIAEEDALLNAARVQLLAKALREAQNTLVNEGHTMQGVIIAMGILADALAEAGLQEKVG